MTLRYIHTADIHLDSPLCGLSAYQDAPAEQLRGATREAFRQLITLAIEERVDFVIIAGDLYDGDWPDFNTGLFFCAEMGRLQRAGISAFVLFGNHDAESNMTRALRLPDNVRCFSAKVCETHVIEQLKVALHGRSFKVRETTENLVQGYAAPLRDYFNIGVLHTALQGGYSGHANYAPCSLDELHAKGYDYWALGHVHEYKLWADRSTICFPGNLQGRSIRETGRRGAVMVTVGEDHQPQVERLFIDVLRWEHVMVDVSDCDSLDAVGIATGRHLIGLLESDAQVPRAVRVSLQGESPIHGELFQREQELRAHVLAEIAAIAPERLWLEKVKLATRPMVVQTDAALGGDALAELEALLGEARHDQALLQELREDFNQMLAKAPDLLAEVPALKLTRDGDLGALLDNVLPGLLARLGMKD
ncbi:DNA repair exonuclease [Uliginosibacterium sp. H3]|uniref:DNA repair exonuclease n=1 Tax=Uliginosibacterium silvisoli TaxID=3114758 RepID=A0ABU6K7R6_9RHOO|nr:DNA repair exonuclease [Uliginosibacterium sp. H3]